MRIRKDTAYIIILGIITLPFLYMLSTYNYLLFHTLIELFSIIVSITIFLFSWNTRKHHKNFFLTFIGISFFFIALLDLLHTITYKGMNIIPGLTADIPTQLWITSRYIQAFSLIIATSCLKIRRRIYPSILFIIYAAVTALSVSAIFIFKIFPSCFIEGEGLTKFKKVSEVLISLIFIGSAYLLRRGRKYFIKNIYRLILASIFFTIASEISFIFYINVFGISNLIGHIFKFVAYYCLYRAIVYNGLKAPINLLLFDLKQSEKKHQQTINILDNLIQERNMEIEENKYRLKVSQAHYSEFINKSSDLVAYWKVPDGIYIDTAIPIQKEKILESVCIDANRSFWEANGFTQKEGVLGRMLGQITNTSQMWQTLQDFIDNNYQTENFTFYKQFSNGKDFYGLVSLYGFKKENKLTHLWTIIKDITEGKRSELKIQQSLNEKEILLRELYHRTKNNMQVISSMLNLKSMFSKNKLIQIEFEEMSQKIQTMSLVHEKLYKSRNLSRINIKEYVEDLIPLLCSSFSYDPMKIRTNLHIQNFSVLIDLAIPIGLILNETISNMFKHAFIRNEGIIEIVIERIDNNISIQIRDDGEGLPEDIDIYNTGTLGIQTLIALVRDQLSGKISFINEDGLKISIMFKTDLYSDRVENSSNATLS